MKQKKYFVELLLPLAAVLLLAALFLSRKAFQTGIHIDVSPVSAKKSNFHFIPEHWREAKLQQLRRDENFKDLRFSDQLDLFLKLCDWTHRQWRTSIPDPYPLSNAVDILADIRSGKTGGFCGQYAYVLADVLKAMGFFAVRYVELWSATGESHFVVEAWSDQFGKWLVLDPAENIYYEIPGLGVPASALEVRSALLGAGPATARAAGEPRAERGRHKLHLYANFAVSLRSDLMRSTRPLTVGDRFAMFLFFRDERIDPGAFNGRIPYSHVTSRVEDIYFDCNYVRVEHRIDKKARQAFFTFTSEGSMFNFDRFALSLDRGKSWRPCADSLSVPLAGGNSSLWVAPVNMLGRFGRPTKVDIIAE
ncbi:MAG: transglutaminase-like domain-containing protein [Acidobacteria bacterium]|jgi:hypothetical protein|nr:transglutaminase-like domain-containing protein [Acidobacteriota bacterium]